MTPCHILFLLHLISMYKIQVTPKLVVFTHLKQVSVPMEVHLEAHTAHCHLLHNQWPATAESQVRMCVSVCGSGKVKFRISTGLSIGEIVVLRNISQGVTTWEVSHKLLANSRYTSLLKIIKGGDAKWHDVLRIWLLMTKLKPEPIAKFNRDTERCMC